MSAHWSEKAAADLRCARRQLRFAWWAHYAVKNKHASWIQMGGLDALQLNGRPLLVGRGPNRYPMIAAPEGSMLLDIHWREAYMVSRNAMTTTASMLALVAPGVAGPMIVLFRDAGPYWGRIVRGEEAVWIRSYKIRTKHHIATLPAESFDKPIPLHTRRQNELAESLANTRTRA